MRIQGVWGVLSARSAPNVNWNRVLLHQMLVALAEGRAGKWVVQIPCEKYGLKQVYSFH